jgi:5'-nucleotidase
MVAVCGALVTAACGSVGLPAQVADADVDVQLLAINDFHGALEPASGGTGRIGSLDAGGVEFLATHLARLRATNPNTVVVSAGDNIGGSPLLSSLSHDEASVEALNLAGLQLSAVGNHDLDEGWWELYRIQNGGCHPVDGCQDGTPFDGAKFAYLAANITLHPERADSAELARAGVRGREPRPLFPPYAIREVAGVRLGFIGVILRDAPSVIIPASVRGLSFGPEADAVNEAAGALRREGVRAVVVLMHKGGEGAADINGCDLNGSRALVDIVQRMSEDVDVVVSGHSHQAYTCTIGNKLVTSASSAGRVITDIDLRIRRADGEVVAKTAHNVMVSREVPKAEPVTALLAHYRPVADRIGNRVVGAIEGTFSRMANDAGETTLGNLIADALLEAARGSAGPTVEFAFWNPGGIRADLLALRGTHPTPVTYAQLFSVLPFGNELIVKSLKGDTVLAMLEQQFGERVRIMQTSKGFTYAYDARRPQGHRVDRGSIRINGAPLDSGRTYRVATSNFLWGGGDGLGVLAAGTDPLTVGVDVDAVVGYLSRHSPVRPPTLDRIRRTR